MTERPTISEARSFPKGLLAPCNTCSLEPSDCDNQYGPFPRTDGEIVLMCMKYGQIKRLTHEVAMSVGGVTEGPNGQP